MASEIILKIIQSIYYLKNYNLLKKLIFNRTFLIENIYVFKFYFIISSKIDETGKEITPSGRG